MFEPTKDQPGNVVDVAGSAGDDVLNDFEPTRSPVPAKITIAVLAVIAVLSAVVAVVGIVGWPKTATEPVTSSTLSYAPAPTVTEPFSAAPGSIPTTVPLPTAADPARVLVPSVGIDQAVKNIDTGADNVLHPPTGSAGWYVKSAPITSSSGSTVLAGHVNTDNGGSGPFARLAAVKAGDPVTVTGADGVRTDWRVISAQNYGKNAVPASVYVTSGSPRQMVLITCGGTPTGVVPGTNLPSFPDNVVIVAVPAGSDGGK